MKRQVAGAGTSTRRRKAGKERVRSVRKDSAGVARDVHQVVRRVLFFVLGVMSYLSEESEGVVVKRPGGAYQMRVSGGGSFPTAFSLSAMSLRVSGMVPSGEVAMMSHRSKS